MKLSIAMLAMCLTLSAHAGVSVNKSAEQGGNIQIKLTGQEAKLLSEIAYEDSALDNVAHAKNDYSNIRSIRCSDGECLVVVEGDISSKADMSDLYSSDFNKKLKNLKDGQLLVVAPSFGKGFMGESHEYDGKVTRALLQNHTYGESKAKLTKGSLSKIGKADVGSVDLFKVEKNLGALKITCHSTLYIEMGNKNFVSESCSVEAVAKLE